MPENNVDPLEELDRIAAYDGPWARLRNEIPLLKTRLAELHAREQRLDDVLMIALVGGSGVGKSTLLNALAGDQLAKTSEFRPCTARPTVYHPPGVTLDFNDWKCVSGSALENLVIIDTPDSDTIIHAHREQVIDVLGQCDLIMLCGSAEKYLDEATWSLLRPLQGERGMVCVETKARAEDSIQEHWAGKLGEQGFAPTDYFRVNALRTLDRKIGAGAPGEEELDFPRLEAFLHNELTKERIQRIKRSNAAGLLCKTVARLKARLDSGAQPLAELEAHLDTARKALGQESLDVVQARLFAESHLWAYALGREIGLRAKGLTGNCFRVIEAIRTLPARIAGWLPGRGARGLGREAAAMLTSEALFQDDLEAASSEVCMRYQSRQGEVALALAKAGFDAADAEAGLDDFREAVNQRVTAVLRGPARDTVMGRARLLTGWPATLLADIPPLAFFAYAAYIIVSSYFSAALLDIAFLVHSAAVLAIVLVVELFAFTLLVRVFAWSARKRALRHLRAAFSAGPLGFAAEQQTLETAKEIAARIEKLHGAL